MLSSAQDGKHPKAAPKDHLIQFATTTKHPLLISNGSVQGVCRAGDKMCLKQYLYTFSFQKLGMKRLYAFIHYLFWPSTQYSTGERLFHSAYFSGSGQDKKKTPITHYETNVQSRLTLTTHLSMPTSVCFSCTAAKTIGGEWLALQVLFSRELSTSTSQHAQLSKDLFGIQA